MTDLTFQQRKALRRLGRGQSIKRSMKDDLVIQKCIDTSHYVAPPDIKSLPYPESMLEWCDWNDRAKVVNKPRLNEYGKRLLEEIGDTP